MATIREVSRLAGVSTATVSRVLNGTSKVAAPTRERVLQAIATLDFTPNTFARGLATNRSGGIGLTVNEISSPYFGAVIHGVEQVVRARGMHLMVSSGNADAALERASVEFLLQRRCDGLIVQADALPDEVLSELVQRGDVPVVVFGRSVAEIDDACVVADNELGGTLATEHLLRYGHRHIGHITGPLSYADARDRLGGYRRALETAGIAYDERYVVESTFREEGGHAAAHLLERAPELTAIFLANDQMAAGAIRTLREGGHAIPTDISVVGYDDVFLARYLTPTLTTVRQPLVEMGRAAADLLLARLDGEPREVMHRFDPALVERQSVARAAR